ncbi:hypothetical protein HHL11_15830 [Ramlibacter sp. G-1-2-2]|uniref:Formate dehydrogenase n=1 Tax=Ramlibacter agri TaxID=2728837 RepID=A0A848H3S4_9BURK|nr:hypothetical protein [Ramlibacter agri]NML45224.1 hypothetical protein [Ramlibacter agri]
MKFTVVRSAACSALLVAGTAGSLAHAAVTPPPLPLGSAMARPEPGLNEPERKRYVRAHHDKLHYRRDYTKDDSVYGMQQFPQAAAPGAVAPGASAGAGAGGAVQGGAGTGPAREKTDRGASSWFYGTNKK